MPQLFRRLLAGACLLASPIVGSAFSLNGPFAAWQSADIGYQIGADLGGPMNLGEEYRWNQSSITYAFDNSFLDYFGQAGVEAVEEAIQILNDLPSTSAMSGDLSEFPLDTRRINHTAAALGLSDLKSYALSALLEQLGLAAPERWVWAIRARVVINNVPFYSIIKRNFDPVTLQPSSYVNGTLYTYVIQQTYVNPDVFEAVKLAVDPLAPSVTTVAALVGVGGGAAEITGSIQSLANGLFYSGLTRDDVGAIRYMYNAKNYNVETLPTGSEVGTGGGFSGGGGGSPFESPFGGGGGGGEPWSPVFSPAATNAAAAGGGVQAGGGGTVATNFARPLIDLGLRAGVEKIQLRRVNYDSLLGVVLSYTNRFVDNFITNGVARSQAVQVVSAQPDIVFSAGDLGVIQELPVTYSRNVNFVNQDAVNGVAALAGPGTIQGGAVISFSSVGPWWDQVGEGSVEEDGLAGFLWGRYDGSTNAPTVFPSGVSIQELERRVLGGR